MSQHTPYSLLKIGSDAEMILWDKEKGKPIPICGLLGGTKENPLPVPSYGPGYAVQEDNVLIEYNIPPFDSAHNFANAHLFMGSYLTKKFESSNKVPSSIPSIFFDLADLQTEQAQRIGCEPDYCVWTDAANSPGENPLIKKGFRTTGYHMHFSYLVGGKLPNIPQMKRMVKLNDLFLGAYSLNWDSDSSRRQLYGQAGAFRPKPYGHEYRVLSGRFSGNSSLAKSLFQRSVEMFYWLNAVGEDFADSLLLEIEDPLKKAINSADYKLGVDLSKVIRTSDRS